MKRLKAHVRSSEGSLTVFTDHSATKQIVEKTTLDTTSTDRANRRLVNASIYLSEYELRVFHIPGKKNFVPDTLSRLEAPETDGNARRLRPNYTALDDMCMGVESLMSQETKDKFIQGYINNTKYLPILKMILDSTDKPVNADRLHSEDAMSTSKRGVPFALKDRLLYHKQTDRYLRLIGNYMPIRPPVTPMHTITIDFITDLPPISSAGSP
ncbi:hypothetical protein FNYG_14749 [Fusarium nygamai]|uniref:Reverse transcriptase RNase H-like domain-containing protein n=1 Tax=Gibberella nygamai TaxID=42673 RepID=A0A2K0UQ75_GIBNY|nr:hypothetical protein FNYG_14749 [Fusarium nygamai]